MLLSAEQLRQLGIKVFEKAGVCAKDAEIVTNALLIAELDGLASHGFSRIPFYADQVISGKIAKDAIPAITNPAPAVLIVDAGNGFAFPAITQGLEAAIPLAKQNGIAAMSVRRSHHCGVLGLYAEELANAGLISLIFSNTPSAMAPWGGSKSSFGTNPIAFGCPREKAAPIVVDLSLSKVARGKVMNAKQKGEKIPEGWALDAEGKPTTDPEAALKGSMIPLGDAKGYALALMVEILCATLAGSNYAFEASSFFEATGPAPGIAQSFILIDPKPFNQNFAVKLEALMQHILDQQGTRIPGERRLATRAKNHSAGVNLPDALYEKLNSYLN